MNYQQFINAVKQEMKGSVAGEIEISIQDTLKNNGVRRKGLLLQEKGQLMSPTIYLEEYYQQYRTGVKLEDITEQIQSLYRELRMKPITETRFLYEYEQVKDRIVLKVINREKNEELLETIPYWPFLDLAIVFYVLLDINEAGAATMPVNLEHLKIWNVTEQELLKKAKENAVWLLPAQIRTMSSIVAEIMGAAPKEEVEDFMFVLSNSLRCLGAVCIAYDEVLYLIGEQLGENYFVLPSSIHEVIIVPESASPGYSDLNEMIREINQTQVAEEEVLGDHAYYYDCAKKELRACCSED